MMLAPRTFIDPTRQPKPEKIRKGIRRVSKKRAKQGRAYSTQRKAFLLARPVCEVCKTARSQDVHHMRGRHGTNYLDETTWCAVCRTCHDWIHTHPREAKARGLLVWERNYANFAKI